MTTPRCVACGDPVSHAQRKYCPKPACKAVQRHRSWVAFRDRAKQGLVKERKPEYLYPRAVASPPKPMSWWVAQAHTVRGACPCGGYLEGVYVPPTQENMAECAVVAHCRMCGRESMVISGRAGVPYEST